MAFAGKHSLAADFVVSNAAFSCVELFVVQNCKDETVIPVSLHCAVILNVILIIFSAKLLIVSDTRKFFMLKNIKYHDKNCDSFSVTLARSNRICISLYYNSLKTRQNASEMHLRAF